MRDATAAHLIDAVLAGRRASTSVVVPRWAPPGWCENDVAEISEAGVWTEYEVKVSRGDFEADADKSVFDPAVGAHVNKHDAILDGKGPRRFYFVTPRGLLADFETPPWAGLLECWRVHSTGEWVVLPAVKAAPELHRRSVPADWLNLAYKAAYVRNTAEQRRAM